MCEEPFKTVWKYALRIDLDLYGCVCEDDSSANSNSVGIQIVLLSRDIGLINRVFIRHVFDNPLNPLLFCILDILLIPTRRHTTYLPASDFYNTSGDKVLKVSWIGSSHYLIGTGSPVSSWPICSVSKSSQVVGTPKILRKILLGWSNWCVWYP